MILVDFVDECMIHIFCMKFSIHFSVMKVESFHRNLSNFILQSI